jgi:hypothetical protein
LSNFGWVRFFIELVWILTRRLIWKSLYISTCNRWSVVPLISPWRWRATSSLEGSSEQIDVQEKREGLERFLGNDFERRLKETQNFSLLGFLWDRVHEARKVEMRGEGTSWRKLIFLFPTRGWDHLKTKLVRGSISCTGEIKND